MPVSEDTCYSTHYTTPPSHFFHVIWGVSGAATGLTILISLVLIALHLKHYSRPEQQRYIVRILLMVPIYAANSWLSLRLYWLSVYFDVLRDCYEAFVILSFFYLLIDMLGGYEHCKDIMERKPSFRPIPPFCCCHVLPRRGFLRMGMRLLLQYVIVRPVVTFAILVLSVLGLYCPGDFGADHGYLYLTIVTSLSVSMAMFALVQFYVLFREHAASLSPGKKFIAVKMVVFLSFWQNVVLAALQYFGILKSTANWSVRDIHDGVQNFLIVFEMLLAAIFHLYAFPYQDYTTGDYFPLRVSIVDVINPSDVWKQSLQSFLFWKRKKHVALSALSDDEDPSSDTDHENTIHFSKTEPLLSNHTADVAVDHGH